MLNRRILRIKVLQALYGYFSGSYDDMAKGEKEMSKNNDRVFHIYLYLLDLILDIWKIAVQEIDQNKQKRLPTQEDLNPNTRFIDNGLIGKLDDNAELTKQLDQNKINWVSEFENNRKLWKLIKESDAYGRYMTAAETDFKTDKEFVIDIFKTFILEDELSFHYLEEKSIYWTNDHEVAAIAVTKTLSSIQEKTEPYHNFLSSIYKDKKDDLEFIRTLYRQTILNSDRYEERISEKAKNWESERIAFIDKLLMKMALCEFENLNEIPTKVTINEYIELSKSFSTRNSRSFVNGILDNLLIEMKANGEITKIGRGLIE